MKIYIVSPYVKSGGPRSLHQLGNNLVNLGMEVYVYYGHRGKERKTKSLLYPDSKMKIAQNIEDLKSNIVIVPESDTGWLKKFKHVKKVIWWLSLNFYLSNNLWWYSKFRTIFCNQAPVFTILRYVYTKFKEPNISYIAPKNLKNVDYHLYNCEYVHSYLLNNKVDDKQMSYLCGPIDIEEKDKQETISVKENLIIYNPAKASPYMIGKILKYMKKNYPKYKFKALKNLSHDEVLDYLKRAKVYLDLGYFPGPERMPREASMNYCNIITSTLGAAKNKFDVPIPKEFKFDLKKENVSQICKLIVDMCENYSSYINKFDKYREKTRKQIRDFSINIDEFKEKVVK